ncbi:phosphoribosylaminoimidazole carboxylase [Methanomicrobiaceae archaeon CYW5]|uniref:nickel pincer cofactor biosynthesis protein LarB n=1 Tax=Methanovulcanius yangii TaxID=1789227 RepID=UPI0029C9DD34|nr:nickel pincer cofactor biosynthesis protein LarB [Methanovulcanius yangii]MBT8507860.1 phosphoribosylaminoimidazole carboxylase [Methanovulcanius yangii]
MNPHATLSDILKSFQSGEISLRDAEMAIHGMEIEEIGEIAHFDAGRHIRCGMPEVVLSEGKEVGHLVSIVNRVVETSGRCVVTRVAAERFDALREAGRENGYAVEENRNARIAIASRVPPPEKNHGVVGIITAGTSDIAVAEEARVIAEEMGCTVHMIHDVGAAGIHRLFPALGRVQDADVYIVVAGREGTLPTVVAGLVDRPVIGVPVSTGYGYMGQGEAALASMLQSCAVIAVVNIDAGFTAGAFAAQIARGSSKQ